MMKTALLYDNFCKTGNDVIYDVIIWVQDGNCKKMAQENFSIGAFYNITKNQDNPIKNVGRDSFLSPKTPNNTSFLRVTQPPWVAQSLYSMIEIGSKTAEKNCTNKQTDDPTDTTKIMVTWPWTNQKEAVTLAEFCVDCGGPTFCHVDLAENGPFHHVNIIHSTLYRRSVC